MDFAAAIARLQNETALRPSASATHRATASVTRGRSRGFATAAGLLSSLGSGALSAPLPGWR